MIIDMQNIGLLNEITTFPNTAFNALPQQDNDPSDNPDVREVILLTGTVDSTTAVTGIVND